MISIVNYLFESKTLVRNHQKIKTYDKVKWHFPDGKNCSSLEAGKLHIEVLMKWLKLHSLLSEYGKEIFEIGVDQDTSITSQMLTQEGRNILDKCYDKWLRTVVYGKKPSTSLLDGYYKLESKGDRR